MRVLYSVVLCWWLAACQSGPAEPVVAAPAVPPLRERLAKTWLLHDFRALHRTAPGASAADRQKERLLEARVLFHFFPDGQWAFIEGERYHAGQWTLDERNKIHCTYVSHDSAQTLFIQIRRLTQDSLVADLTRRKQTLSAILVTDGYDYNSPEKCPWHPVNNAWRRPADHPETTAEIKTRAINHLRHYYTLLDATLANNGHTVTVLNSPSCIQIYSSGIGLRRPESIDAAWYATFYNRQDAEKCLRMFGAHLDADGVLTGPKTRNWISDDLTLIQRLMNQLQGEE